jgi:hypothetical protein
MANETLLAYVKKELERGSDIEAVKKILLETGWPKADIESALEETQKDISNRAPLTPADPVKANIEAPLVATIANYEPSTVRYRSPGNSKYFMLAGAFSIFLFAAGVLGYYFYNPRPAIIIERMFAAIQQVGSMKNKMDLQIKSEGDIGSTELKIIADTEYDINDEKNIKNRTKIGLDLIMSENDKTESITLGGTIESIINDDIQYLKITGVDFRIKGGEGETETNTMIGGLIGAINGAVGNQWIKIDPKETEQLTKSFISPEAARALEEQKKQQEAYQKEKDEKIQEKLPEILALIQQTNFIDFERVRSEKINDTNTYLIVGSLNKASTKNFILEAEKILMSNIFAHSLAQSMGLSVANYDPADLMGPPSGLKAAGLLSYGLAQSLNKNSSSQGLPTGLMTPGNMTQEQKDALKMDLERSVDEIMTKISSSKIEMWIGKKDYLPYQINLKLDIAEQLLASPLAAKTSDGLQQEKYPGKTSLTYKMSLKDFNVPIEMEEPSDPISIVEITDILSKKILGGSVNSVNDAGKTSPVKARDSRRISDIRQIQLGLEIYADSRNYYPISLSELSPAYMARIPTDPSNGMPYIYSYYPATKPIKYHLGASLEENAIAPLSRDSDLNATNSPNGFDGNDNKKCKPNDFGSYCYDVAN